MHGQTSLVVSCRNVVVMASDRTRLPTTKKSRNRHAPVEPSKNARFDSSSVLKICHGSMNARSIHRGSSLFSGIQATGNAGDTQSSKSSTSSSSSCSSREDSDDKFHSELVIESVEADEDLFETDAESVSWFEKDETVMASNKDKQRQQECCASLFQESHSVFQAKGFLDQKKNDEYQRDCASPSSRAIVAFHQMKCRNINVQFKPNFKAARSNHTKMDNSTTRQPVKEPVRGILKVAALLRGEEQAPSQASKTTSKPKNIGRAKSISHLDEATIRKLLLWKKAKRNADELSMKARQQQQQNQQQGTTCRDGKNSLPKVTLDCKPAPAVEFSPHGQLDEARARKVVMWQKAKCHVRQVKQKQVERQAQAIADIHNEKHKAAAGVGRNRVPDVRSFDRVCL